MQLFGTGEFSLLAGDGDTGLAQFLAGGRAAVWMEALRRERWLSVKTGLQRPRWSRPSFICMLQPSRQQGVKTAGRGSEEDGILKRATDGQPADAGGSGLNERRDDRRIPGSGRLVVKRNVRHEGLEFVRYPLSAFCVARVAHQIPRGYGGGASASQCAQLSIL